MKSDVWIKFLKELKQNSTKMSNYFRKTIHLESPLKLRLTEIDKDEEVADLLTSSFTEDSQAVFSISRASLIARLLSVVPVS